MKEKHEQAKEELLQVSGGNFGLVGANDADLRVLRRREVEGQPKNRLRTGQGSGQKRLNEAPRIANVWEAGGI